MELTSDLRRALCKAIVETVMRGDTALKAGLSETLALHPFEIMSDDTLDAMARELIRDADVDALIVANSPDLYEAHHSRYLCGDCRDVGMVDTGDGWRRCERCNPRDRVLASTQGEF